MFFLLSCFERKNRSSFLWCSRSFSKNPKNRSASCFRRTRRTPEQEEAAGLPTQEEEPQEWFVQEERESGSETHGFLFFFLRVFFGVLLCFRRRRTPEQEEEKKHARALLQEEQHQKNGSFQKRERFLGFFEKLLEHQRRTTGFFAPRRTAPRILQESGSWGSSRSFLNTKEKKSGSFFSLKARKESKKNTRTVLKHTVWGSSVFQKKKNSRTRRSSRVGTNHSSSGSWGSYVFQKRTPERFLGFFCVSEEEKHQSGSPRRKEEQTVCFRKTLKEEWFFLFFFLSESFRNYRSFFFETHGFLRHRESSWGSSGSWGSWGSSSEQPLLVVLIVSC